MTSLELAQRRGAGTVLHWHAAARQTLNTGIWPLRSAWSRTAMVLVDIVRGAIGYVRSSEEGERDRGSNSSRDRPRLTET
jgi:hypothetical protein